MEPLSPEAANSAKRSLALCQQAAFLDDYLYHRFQVFWPTPHSAPTPVLSTAEIRRGLEEPFHCTAPLHLNRRSQASIRHS
jgi:hypothetical protein